MLRNYFGIINMDEDAKKLYPLIKKNNAATLPVGGRYRIIDFSLSNLVNAGINHIFMFTENTSRTLNEHLSNGRPWDLDRKIGGLYVVYNRLMDYNQDCDKLPFENNLDLLNKISEEYVVILPSYMICNVDIEEVAECFEKSNADIMVVYKKVKNADKKFINCITYNVDMNGKVTGAARNAGIRKTADISMEIFVMKRSLLCDLLFKASCEGKYYKLKEFISAHIDEYNIVGHRFDGYLSCINSVNDYYAANINLIDIQTMGTLFNKNNPIYTRTKDSPPVRYAKTCNVHSSLIADGTVVKGKVKNSVISRNVLIEENVEIDGCIILENAIIRQGTKLSNVIVGNNVLIEKNSQIKCPKSQPLAIDENVINM